jgi:hypothetical protein
MVALQAAKRFVKRSKAAAVDGVLIRDDGESLIDRKTVRRVTAVTVEAGCAIGVGVSGDNTSQTNNRPPNNTTNVAIKV